MDSKNILIVTHGFFPEISPRSFRATELAKEFVRQGHSVTVIAPQREGLEKLLEEFNIDFIGYQDVSWKVPKFPIEKAPFGMVNRVITRMSSWLFEYPTIQIMGEIRRKLKDLKGYDLLISIAVPYPVHWGVAKIWEKGSKDNPAKVWVADCGDPYMGQQNDTFIPPFYFGWLEKDFCRKADYLSLPTPNSFEAYYQEFHSKVKVIPQGFKFEEYRSSQSSRKEGKMVFGYGGMFIPGRRDPREFLEYLMEIEEQSDFEFHVFTNTPQHVESFSNRSSSIVLHDVVDRMELMKRFSEMDFLVNFTNVGKAQTPSKLIDYAILGKPILNIETGNLDKELINQFLKRDYSNTFVIENPDQYRIENVTAKFLSLI